MKVPACFQQSIGDFSHHVQMYCTMILTRLFVSVFPLGKVRFSMSLIQVLIALGLRVDLLPQLLVADGCLEPALCILV